MWSELSVPNALHRPSWYNRAVTNLWVYFSRGSEVRNLDYAAYMFKDPNSNAWWLVLLFCLPANGILDILHPHFVLILHLRTRVAIGEDTCQVQFVLSHFIFVFSFISIGWVNGPCLYTESLLFNPCVIFRRELNLVWRCVRYVPNRANTPIGHLVVSTQCFHNKCLVKSSNSNFFQ
jgi:hypothetical protein